MRKIEEKLFKAIRARKSFHKDNTTVEYDGVTGEAQIRLHGNLIAYEKDQRKTLVLTFCGWSTRTTSSRLCAIIEAYGLGLYACIKAGIGCFVYVATKGVVEGRIEVTL